MFEHYGKKGTLFYMLSQLPTSGRSAYRKRLQAISSRCLQNLLLNWICTGYWCPSM